VLQHLVNWGVNTFSVSEARLIKLSSGSTSLMKCNVFIVKLENVQDSTDVYL